MQSRDDDLDHYQKIVSATTRTVNETTIVNITNPDIQILDTFGSSKEVYKCSNETITPYEFINGTLAAEILKKLDIYKPLTTKILKQLSYKPVRTRTYMGFRKDDKYCDKRREFFAKYPDSVFDERNVYLAESSESQVYGLTVPGYLQAKHLDRHKGLSKAAQRTEAEDLNPFLNIFYTKGVLYKYFHVGAQFSCLTQISNHIPGSATLCSRSRVAKASREYLENYKARPQCFGGNKLFLKSWLLYEKDDCNAFFKLINDPSYLKLRKEKNIVYIKKITGIHGGKAIHPLNMKSEEKLRTKYANGTKCGKVKTYNIMQDYIYNPLLLNNKKFDFTIFMLVASVNPLMVYYHDGYLSVSLMPYSPISDDRNALLTNLAMKKEIENDKTREKLFGKMTAEEVRQEQHWSFERFQKHLLDTGKITDPDWLNNYLRPEFKKAMVHLTRIGLSKYFSDSSLYELLGVDFMLDNDLRLWFLEVNDSPSFSGYSVPMKEFIMKMLRDQFEVVFGLLKSRAKRIVDLVNGIMAECNITFPKGKVTFPDLDVKIAKFENITKNYFEKEFELNPDNGFAKIVDENYQGAEIYQGLFPAGCL